MARHSREKWFLGADKNVEFDGSLKMLIFPLKGKRGVLLAFLGAFSGAISQFYYLSFYFISSFFQPTLQHSFTFQVIPETLSHNTILLSANVPKLPRSVLQTVWLLA